MNTWVFISTTRHVFLRENFLNILPALGDTNSKPSEYKKINQIVKKMNRFPCLSSKWIYNLQNSYIVYYSIKCIIWTLPNICMQYLSMKKLKSITLFNTFLLIPLKWKLQLKQGLKLFKMTQKDIHILSNLFLHFIKLTWHHYNYNHTSIHYNHEIINAIKIQNGPLKSFFC
jgi:hypothetical protein